MKLMFVLSLAAAYLATEAHDAKKIADLHRLRDDAFRDDPPDENTANHLSAFLRAAEVAIPTADAKAAAERLAGFLDGKEDYSFDNPNGPAGNSPAGQPPAPPQQEQQPPLDAESAETEEESEDFKKGRAAALDAGEVPEDASEDFMLGYESVASDTDGDGEKKGKKGRSKK